MSLEVLAVSLEALAVSLEALAVLAESEAPAVLAVLAAVWAAVSALEAPVSPAVRASDADRPPRLFFLWLYRLPLSHLNCIVLYFRQQ